MSIAMQKSILNTIKDAHLFTDGLINGSTHKSVHRDLLLRELKDSIEINVALFELKELGIMDFNFSEYPDIIFVPK